MVAGQPLILSRDQNNVADVNAIRVLSMIGTHVAFIERDIAAIVAPIMDSGIVVLCKLKKPTRFLARMSNGAQAWSTPIAFLWIDYRDIHDNARTQTGLIIPKRIKVRVD